MIGRDRGIPASTNASRTAAALGLSRLSRNPTLDGGGDGTGLFVALRRGRWFRRILRLPFVAALLSVGSFCILPSLAILFLATLVKVVVWLTNHPVEAPLPSSC